MNMDKNIISLLLASDINFLHIYRDLKFYMNIDCNWFNSFSILKILEALLKLGHWSQYKFNCLFVLLLQHADQVFYAELNGIGHVLGTAELVVQIMGDRS